MSTETVLYESLDHKLSQEYTQIVLGMDEFYRKSLTSGTESSLDNEGLVPINLTKETPNSYNSWNDIFSDLENLRSKYASIQSEVRRNYMQQQIGSLLTLARWRSGEDIPFRENVRGLLYVNENPFSEAERKGLHLRLDSLLTQRGFTGALGEKVKKWEQAQHVPSQQVESVLKDLLLQGKKRVVQKMFKEMEDVM